DKAPRFRDAIEEAEQAVGQVGGGEEAVELSPQSSYIRRLQHLIAERNELSSQSQGRDPNRRVKIFKEKSG
ncbi:MAG: single-stranded DNA-binding protein, partial [Dehalococcoidales bacterium]|nr:single-stranded DNA-binding protein [Dehalococcoidales bacterium]